MNPIDAKRAGFAFGGALVATLYSLRNIKTTQGSA